MSKTIKTNKQYEHEKQHGKISYRKRLAEEKEAEEELEEFVTKYQKELTEHAD